MHRMNDRNKKLFSRLNNLTIKLSIFVCSALNVIFEKKNQDILLSNAMACAINKYTNSMQAIKFCMCLRQSCLLSACL